MLGSNAAGLKSKTESFFNLFNKFKPSVVTIQESKHKKSGMLKIPGYQTFEKIRNNKAGGGLLTTVDEDLNPVLFSSGKDDIEILTVEIQVGNKKMRIINCYGPQEDEHTHEIMKFWQELETEVIKAKDDGCLIIIEMDANAKVGKDVIKNDPNNMTNNGKLFLDMIERQNLKIANSLDICKGTITRERIFEKKTEKSVIDYIVICDELLKHLMGIYIDEERVNVLCRYMKTKTGFKTVMSDHNVLYCRFSLTFNRKPSFVRKEFFNFKCEEGKKKFLEETSLSGKLTSCFNNGENFEKSAKLFHKTLNKTFYKCFIKVRVRTENKKQLGNEIVQKHLKLKSELKVFLMKNK